MTASFSCCDMRVIRTVTKCIASILFRHDLVFKFKHDFDNVEHFRLLHFK